MIKFAIYQKQSHIYTNYLYRCLCFLYLRATCWTPRRQRDPIDRPRSPCIHPWWPLWRPVASLRERRDPRTCPYRLRCTPVALSAAVRSGHPRFCPWWAFCTRWRLCDRCRDRRTWCALGILLEETLQHHYSWSIHAQVYHTRLAHPVLFFFSIKCRIEFNEEERF